VTRRTMSRAPTGECTVQTLGSLLKVKFVEIAPELCTGSAEIRCRITVITRLGYPTTLGFPARFGQW
jgi:hypothetical protein